MSTRHISSISLLGIFSFSRSGTRKRVRPQLGFEDCMNLGVRNGENGDNCREKAADGEKWKGIAILVL